MTKLQQQKFTEELELILEYASQHISAAKTKEEANSEIEISVYILKLIVNKYYAK